MAITTEQMISFLLKEAMLAESRGDIEQKEFCMHQAMEYTKKTIVQMADPPKVDPPKADPPKADPPKVDPPKVDPPKVVPPKVVPSNAAEVPKWVTKSSIVINKVTTLETVKTALSQVVKLLKDDIRGKELALEVQSHFEKMNIDCQIEFVKNLSVLTLHVEKTGFDRKVNVMCEPLFYSYKELTCTPDIMRLWVCDHATVYFCKNHLDKDFVIPEGMKKCFISKK